MCAVGLAAMASGLACFLPSDASRGSPCGRNEHADASATLPDTGINARRVIQVTFLQRDPDLLGERSDLAIQQTWPNGVAADTEPDPRVRLLTDSGQVLVDTLGSRFDQPTGQFSDPTWHVFRTVQDAQWRASLYTAFATQSLWLELWHPGASRPGTRILLTTTDFGVYPPAICL
jgi:hypothetical protein